MTKDELFTMVNDGLLDGRTMDADLFTTLLNLARTKVEDYRPWMTLRDEDASGSIPAGNTWDTLITLPTRFRRPMPVKRDNGTYSALMLVNGQEVVTINEIQWPQRLQRQSTFGYYAINYATGKFSLTGTAPKAYTPYWSLLRYSAPLTNDSDEWVFPSDYHPILAYLVAVMEKSRDYDEVNLANIKLYSPEAAAILSSMVSWDDALQRAALGV